MLVREMLSGDLKKFSAGLSAEQRPIEAWANFDFENEIPRNLCLILGATHGNEPATRFLLDSFLKELQVSQPVMIIPVVNPDGWERNSRYTASGVDLNRNFSGDWSSSSQEPSGPFPFSEPESCLLRDLIFKLQPLKIITLHWALAEIDADGIQSAPLALAMWNSLSPELQRPYRLRIEDTNAIEWTNAFCPGSLGRWCGYHLLYPDQSRPMIVTLELPYDPKASARPERLPTDHLETLRAAWKENSSGYLEAAAPGVHQMLKAACEFIPT